MDQINQFFTNFVHEPNVMKLSLIDPSTKQVILSTDRKEEGKDFAIEMLPTDNVIIKDNGTYFQAIASISGLNVRKAILVIDFSKQ